MSRLFVVIINGEFFLLVKNKSERLNFCVQTETETETASCELFLVLLSNQSTSSNFNAFVQLLLKMFATIEKEDLIN